MACGIGTAELARRFLSPADLLGDASLLFVEEQNITDLVVLRFGCTIGLMVVSIIVCWYVCWYMVNLMFYLVLAR